MAGQIHRRKLAGQGTSGVSDVFDATLECDVVHGVEPGSVKVYSRTNTSGYGDLGSYTVHVASDDGAGNIVPEPGRVLGASTIDYATGAIHVEENGVVSEFANAYWCAIDYKSVMVASTDWDQYPINNGQQVQELFSRVAHSSLNNRLERHGESCLSMIPTSGLWFSTGYVFMAKNWDHDDDLSVAMLFRRTNLYVNDDGPVQGLVVRFDGTKCYFVGVNQTGSYPKTYLGIGAWNGTARNSPVKDYGDAVTKTNTLWSPRDWHGMRLDVRTQGSDVLLEVFAVNGREDCDVSPCIWDLPWYSEFSVLHASGNDTPVIVSGSPNVDDWSGLSPILNGKTGFQMGEQYYIASPSVNDRGYISSFQAKKIGIRTWLPAVFNGGTSYNETFDNWAA